MGKGLASCEETQRSDRVKEHKLFLREWATVFLLMGVMALLVAISWQEGRSERESLPPMAAGQNELPLIQIEVTGSVKRPGIYEVVPGTTIKQVLLEAKLEKCADRKKIDFKKVLYSSQAIAVGKKEKELRQKREKPEAI